MYKIREIYYKYLSKYMKYIPIIGIIILFYLYYQQIYIITPTTKNTAPLIQQVENSIMEFTQSFDFSDTTKLFSTIVLLITIWTGYKYWLNNFRIILSHAFSLDSGRIETVFSTIPDDPRLPYCSHIPSRGHICNRIHGNQNTGGRVRKT